MTSASSVLAHVMVTRCRPLGCSTKKHKTEKVQVNKAAWSGGNSSTQVARPMELTVVDDKVNRAWAVGEVERAGKGRMRGDAFFLWVLSLGNHTIVGLARAKLTILSCGRASNRPLPCASMMTWLWYCTV